MANFWLLLWENTLPKLAPSFSKMWKCPQYPKQLQLDTVEACTLPHWMQSLVFKTLALADQSNQ